ncbi:hypothetical protein F4806DRAFT_499519 [Annulohypoxylon nitens]|nr:hypothetical protein F4806DRAFT_499519 [Annulohypoxylon nitens]
MDLEYLWLFLEGIVSFYIFKYLWYVYTFTITNTFVEQRNILIPYGRHLQRKFRIPVWLRIISERDPGISDHGIRLLITAMIFLPILSLGSFMATIPTAGTVFDRGVLFTSLGIPVCMGICIWILLLFGERRQRQAGAKR